MKLTDLPPLPRVSVTLRGAAYDATVPTQAIEMLVGEKLPVRVPGGKTQELNAEFRAKQMSDSDLQNCGLLGVSLGITHEFGQGACVPGPKHTPEEWRAYAEAIAQALSLTEISGVIVALRAATARAEQERLTGDGDQPGN